jgi:hypothetical protein
MSESVLKYEELSPGGHRPDVQYAVCTSCKAEVTIVETADKMPNFGYKMHDDFETYEDFDETVQRLGDELRRVTRGDPPEWRKNG